MIYNNNGKIRVNFPDEPESNITSQITPQSKLFAHPKYDKLIKLQLTPEISFFFLMESEDHKNEFTSLFSTYVSNSNPQFQVLIYGLEIGSALEATLTSQDNGIILNSEISNFKAIHFDWQYVELSAVNNVENMFILKGKENQVKISMENKEDAQRLAHIFKKHTEKEINQATSDVDDIDFDSNDSGSNSNSNSNSSESSNSEDEYGDSDSGEEEGFVLKQDVEYQVTITNTNHQDIAPGTQAIITLTNDNWQIRSKDDSSFNYAYDDYTETKTFTSKQNEDVLKIVSPNSDNYVLKFNSKKDAESVLEIWLNKN